MKKVFSSNSQLCKTWATQSQVQGRSGNMFFHNNKIYSYGYHYEAGVCLEGYNGENVFFVNENYYSRSTAKQTATIYNSISKGYKVFRIPFIMQLDCWGRRYDTFDYSTLTEILGKIDTKINNLIKKQIAARKYCGYFVQASMIFDELTEICQLFEYPLPKKSHYPDFEKAEQKAKQLMQFEQVN
jgi:hypothetical protein